MSLYLYYTIFQSYYDKNRLPTRTKYKVLGVEPNNDH